jgi:hypothetical protein
MLEVSAVPERRSGMRFLMILRRSTSDFFRISGALHFVGRPEETLRVRHFAKTLVAAPFSLTELGIVGQISALAFGTVHVSLVLDKAMDLVAYQLPRVKGLLAAKAQGAKITLYVQTCTGTQHQKVGEGKCTVVVRF